jgi:hypothetical protein
MINATPEAYCSYACLLFLGYTVKSEVLKTSGNGARGSAFTDTSTSVHLILAILLISSAGYS